mmetsp:Transcript_26028/g.65183  ORF Transcript_26028/g.65183 Transcript_26028/m.65183 type:complete len:220 (-) Transcript_26028:76-735(-)
MPGASVLAAVAGQVRDILARVVHLASQSAQLFANRCGTHCGGAGSWGSSRGVGNSQGGGGGSGGGARGVCIFFTRRCHRRRCSLLAPRHRCRTRRDASAHRGGGSARDIHARHDGGFGSGGGGGGGSSGSWLGGAPKNPSARQRRHELHFVIEELGPHVQRLLLAHHRVEAKVLVRRRATRNSYHRVCPEEPGPKKTRAGPQAGPRASRALTGKASGRT